MLHTGKGIYPDGRNTTWFDKPQNQVKMSDFDISETLFDELELTNLSLEYISFSNIAQNFDGTVDTLYGFNDFRSNVLSDLEHNDTYSIGTLSLSNIDTDILRKEGTGPINIGTSNLPFDIGFFETSIVLGDAENHSQIGMNSDNQLELKDAPLKLQSAEGIIFSDGSTLSAMATEGGDANSVEGFSYKFFNSSNLHRVTAKVSFKQDRVGVPGSELNKVYTYEMGESGMIVPDKNGSYMESFEDNVFTLKDAVLVEQTNNKTVDVNLYDETGDARNKMILSSYKPESVNDIIDVNTIIPDTLEFKQKFYTDFNYFYNKRLRANPNKRKFKSELPYGYISGENTHPGYSKFIKDSVSDLSSKQVMRYISYFDLPFIDESTMENADSNYHCNNLNDAVDRYNGRYVCFGTDGDDTIYQKNDGRILPKIAFRRWLNDRNDTIFEITPHPNESGWEYVDESSGIVNVNEIDNDWKDQLLRLAYAYVKYGNANKLDEDDTALLDEVDISKLTSSNFTPIRTTFGAFQIYTGVQINNLTTFVEPVNDGKLNIHESLF